MPEENKNTAKGLSFVDLIIVVLVAIIAGGASNYFADQFLSPKNGIEMPVAVVDLNTIVDANKSVKLPKGETLYGYSLKQATQLAERLSSNGYIVLKEGAIWGAPEMYNVSPAQPATEEAENVNE